MAHEINTALFCWSVEKQLPRAHTPDVDVHEVRAAIVPYSAAMQAQVLNRVRSIPFRMLALPLLIRDYPR
jgi:hypothetical protein